MKKLKTYRLDEVENLLSIAKWRGYYSQKNNYAPLPSIKTNTESLYSEQDFKKLAA